MLWLKNYFWGIPLVIYLMCSFLHGCLLLMIEEMDVWFLSSLFVWHQFVLAKNLSKEKIVGYLCIDFTFAKTNIQAWCWIWCSNMFDTLVRCWIRCSNILARFIVPCLCAKLYVRFILLKNLRLISCWPSSMLFVHNQIVNYFLKLCQQFGKLWICLDCS